MSLVFCKKLVTPGVALAILVATGAVSADPASDLTEARQETQIWTTYALSPYLRANDLKVVVHGGKATITGKVDEDINKDLAKQIALGVEGIKDVDNQIVVESDYRPTAPARDYGQAIDDASITAAVKSKLVWSKHTDSRTMNVETKDGRVKLTGSADTKQAKEAASRLAFSTRGVSSVNNQLVIENAKSSVVDKTKEKTKEAKVEMTDAWITTKIKSTYLYSTNVSGSSIDVSTVKGNVTLKGKVDSAVERALAIELAQNVRGVKMVNAKELSL